VNDPWYSQLSPGRYISSHPVFPFAVVSHYPVLRQHVRLPGSPEQTRSRIDAEHTRRILRRTFFFEKSQCSITMSRSATLPGMGRGGYATFGGWLWISKYIRSGPSPRVVVTNAVASSVNGEGILIFLGGSAGFVIVSLNCICSGTMDRNKFPLVWGGVAIHVSGL